MSLVTKEELETSVAEENKTAKQKTLLKWEKFCQIYVNGGEEYFGLGVRCYAAIYDIELGMASMTNKKYRAAATAVSRLLKNRWIYTRIQELFTEEFNDKSVDRHHSYLISQHKDLNVKRAAIADYNKMKGRFAPEKSEVTVKDFQKILNSIENGE